MERIQEIRVRKVRVSAKKEAEIAKAYNATGGEDCRPTLPYGVGIDTHSKFIQVCVLVQIGGGYKRFEREFSTTWTDLEASAKWALELAQQGDAHASKPNLRYTIESTGCYHMPVLRAWQGVPSVVNPMLAGPTRRKSDQLDARMLADHGVVGLWPSSFIPSEQTECLRILLNMRHEAGRNKARTLNRINNNLLRFGHTFGATVRMSDMYARGVVDDLCRGVVPVGEGICPQELPVVVRPFFLECYRIEDNWRELQDEYHTAALKYVKESNWAIGGGGGNLPRSVVSGKKLLAALMSIPGVGEVSGMTWLAIIGDPNRFKHPKQVAAFCGADPSLKISAGKVTSHVKRKGNARLHHVLKNVAAQLVRHNREAIGNWGYNIYKRHAKGGWAKAINAVSRRLAIFMWQVHLRGEDFNLDQYKFYAVPDVADVPIDAMGLSSLYANKLLAAGLKRSTDVARAFLTTLPQQKGLGAGCLAKVKAWMDQNPAKAKPAGVQSPREAAEAYLSAAPSTGEVAPSTPTKKRAKSASASPTA